MIGHIDKRQGSSRAKGALMRTSRGLTAGPKKRGSLGFTMIELIAAITILSVLTGMAVPLAKLNIKRERESELRRELWEMRDAIDHYKEAADHGAFQIKLGSQGYPPDLQTLVDGVDVAGKKVRFLRRIPEDPTTGQPEWGMRSVQDDPTSDSWGGDNVFDVYSKSDGTALDGTKYKDW
jgi:general secretion pathway protein G